MRLHVETRGRGANLVLLHGWGMHGGVWHSTMLGQTGQRRVTCMDLPGHGRSEPVEADLDRWAEAALESAPPRAAWLAWSLGGMVALRAAALSPQRITRLVLVCTTPRFVSSDDWKPAVDEDTLVGFAQELCSDHAGTVKRFLSLQVQGDEAAREALRALRGVLDQVPEPSDLGSGLELLRSVDLRGEVEDVQQPALVITGERDRLTPAAAGRWLAEHLPRARHEQIAGAAHAPFLSHPDRFGDLLTDFLGGPMNFAYD